MSASCWPKKPCPACSQDQEQIASSFTIPGISAAVTVGNLGFTHRCALAALGSHQCRLLVPTGNTISLSTHNGNCAHVLKGCNCLDSLHKSGTLRLGKIPCKSISKYPRLGLMILEVFCNLDDPVICWFCYKITGCDNAPTNRESATSVF